MVRNALLGIGIFLLAKPSISQTVTSPEPKAQVTIYSSGNFLKAAMPGYKYGDFIGRIFDEYDQLAYLRPGYFVTFDLDPGPHTFSANTWLSSRPEGGGHLTIDLVANHHYYVGTYTETTPLLVISAFRLEQRTCQQAIDDNLHTKPLDPKQLKKYGQATAVAETSFPRCLGTNPTAGTP
jgi:hypothetical protein